MGHGRDACHRVWHARPHEPGSSPERPAKAGSGALGRGILGPAGPRVGPAASPSASSASASHRRAAARQLTPPWIVWRGMQLSGVLLVTVEVLSVTLVVPVAIPPPGGRLQPRRTSGW
jgi:hypothetical protein